MDCQGCGKPKIGTLLPECPDGVPGCAVAHYIWTCPNCEYVATEPEFFGKFPVRTELIVLPADPPDRKPIGWTVRTYSGFEILRLVTPGEPGVTITKKEDLKVGDEILVMGLFGGYLKMVVEQDEDGDLFARGGEHLISSLAFGEDDRECWVSTGLINTRGIKKLELFKETEAKPGT
jgi:hypothetical protein